MSEKVYPCIHACGRDAKKKDGECKTCKSGYYYWKRKSARERLERRNKLDVLSSRLDTHFDTKGKKNEELLVQPAPKTTGAKIIVLRERRKAGGAR